MNLHAISNFLVSILIIVTGLFTTLKNKKSKINFLFFLLTLSAFIWQLGTGLALSAKYPHLALIATRFAFLGIVLIPVFSYHLSLSIIGVNINRTLVFGYLCALLFFIPLSWTSLIFDGVYTYRWGFFFKAGHFHPLFMAFFIYFMVIIFSKLFLSYKRETNNLEKIRKKYFLIALFIAYIGSIDYLPTYGIKIYPFGYFALICFILIFAYAILRYRLMDITVAITRTSIFIVVYTLVLGIPFVFGLSSKAFLFGIFGQSWWIVPLGLMAFLATTGPFIYLYLQKKAEDRLLREQRRYQETLRQASAGMTRIRDLKKLLKLIVYMVSRAVKLTHACIYLFDPKINQYSLQAVKHKSHISLENLDMENHLIKHLKQYRQPLVYEELKHFAVEMTNLSFALAEAQMKKLNAGVIIPSFVENKLLGFIVMGEKLSGKIFTDEDLAVFSVLANQAALAIENAQFYEEVKETHEQLFQAEKMATLGTMADGLSHQINNRFHALGLISGDALDTIKLADTASLSEETKKLLSEIKHALEKVQDNVMQGGEVVKGLLKYSRPGEEGFEPITLDQIIDASLEMVQYKVKLKELDFVKDYSNDLPKINGNFTQLQEVFFNLIDNAYDAMKQRLDELKEPNYRGKIVVTAQGFDNVLQIKLSDNGMGVKKEDFVKLFTPFFTTKASSRRGTGLGLFVIQKIISNNHKGKISVESEYKKGTTFTIELPVAK